MYRKISDAADAAANQVIEEMMGFSPVTDKLVKEILKYMEDEIAAGNIENKTQDVDDCSPAEVFTLVNYIKEFTVEGKKIPFIIGAGLFNLPATFPDRDMKRYVHEHCNSACARATLNGVSAYALDINLVLVDWKFTTFSKGVAQHELQHAYTFSKKAESEPDETTKLKEKEFLTMYEAASKIMKNKLISMLFPEAYDMAWGIYLSDKEEIASFTQQAYAEMEDVKSFQEVDTTLKSTILYIYYRKISEIYNMLQKDPGLYRDLEFLMGPLLPGDIKMPTYTLYMKIMKKRMDKYATNVGRVIVNTKDRLREDAVKEGYSVPMSIRDTTWSEIYKLGLY